MSLHLHENFIEAHLLLGHSLLSWFLNSCAWLLAVCFIVWPFLVAPFLDWLDFRRQQSVKTVTFELIPYHTTSVSADAMIELFRIMHAQSEPEKYLDRLIRRRNCIALELVSSHAGLCYRLQVPSSAADSFRRGFVALQREIELKQTEQTSVLNESGYSIIEAFRQLRPFSFPLRSHKTLETHDPVNYLTGALTNPKIGEILTVQFILAPYSNPRRVAHIRSRLIRQKGPTPTIQIIRDAMVDKLKEPLFYADIRACISTHTRTEATVRRAAIASALATFDESGYQLLIPESTLHWRRLIHRLCAVVPDGIRGQLRDFQLGKARQRLPSVLTVNSNVLSASEIAGLYHFPYEQAVTAEGLSRSMSRVLAVPNVLKQRADDHAFDLMLGENVYQGNTTPIGLTADERQRHVFVIGGTGNGKTAMLEYGIVQDIYGGKGVAMIDPHGDSARKLLRYIPKERLKDVIYFNPRDYDHPIGLNLLELPKGLSGSALAHEKDLTTEAIISVLSKIFGEEGGGAYRIERILRNAIQTAFTIEDATLFAVLKLLTEAGYRKQIAFSLQDARLKRFWIEEFGKAGDMQRIKLAVGPITRLERFEASESVRRVLGQPRSTINFDEIINSGKILICNFSKGSLGEDTSMLFGATVLAELQLAAWRREKIPQQDRRPFYLYVDEFQNFANDSFVGFFSEARKYGLFAMIAQQSFSQLRDQSLLNTILDNAGTIVAFRSKSRSTEDLLLPQFEPYIRQGDILNLPSYNFYTKVAAATPMEPFSGRTIVLPSEDADEAVAREVVQLSRAHYARRFKHQDETN